MARVTLVHPGDRRSVGRATAQCAGGQPRRSDLVVGGHTPKATGAIRTRRSRAARIGGSDGPAARLLSIRDAGTGRSPCRATCLATTPGSRPVVDPVRSGVLDTGASLPLAKAPLVGGPSKLGVPLHPAHSITTQVFGHQTHGGFLTERSGRFRADRSVVGFELPSNVNGRSGDDLGDGHAATLRGRPRGRFRAMTTPWSKISPPHTPQGSALSSAAARQAARAGQSTQSAFAFSRSPGRSAKNRSGSPVWHGRSSRRIGSTSESGS